MPDPELVGRKLIAVRDKIRAMANEAGYGHFISDATCEQWAAILVTVVDDVENPPAVGAEQIGASTEATGEQ